MDIMERRIQKGLTSLRIAYASLIAISLVLLLSSCATPTVEDTGPTEMTGEPVNIALKGQKEMCEREPESILCKEEEVDE
jgi:hypothetical protein